MVAKTDCQTFQQQTYMSACFPRQRQSALAPERADDKFMVNDGIGKTSFLGDLQKSMIYSRTLPIEIYFKTGCYPVYMWAFIFAA